MHTHTYTNLSAPGARIPKRWTVCLIPTNRLPKPLQAALGFALSRPEATSVIVGVATAPELQAVVAAAMSPPPDLDWDEMALDDPVALDPRRWAAA